MKFHLVVIVATFLYAKLASGAPTTDGLESLECQLDVYEKTAEQYELNEVWSIYKSEMEQCVDDLKNCRNSVDIVECENTIALNFIFYEFSYLSDVEQAKPSVRDIIANVLNKKCGSYV